MNGPLHYWGAKAIMARIGLKDHRCLPYWIQKHCLPAFLRRDPPHPRNTYYTSERLILLWELTFAKHYREELVAKDEARRQRQGKASARVGNHSST